MNLIELLSRKDIKPKEKTELIAGLLLKKKLHPDELIGFAEAAKDPAKATCIEALEYATRDEPGIINRSAFEFASDSLKLKAPRVKWESARVIANTAHLFPDNLDVAVNNLIANSKHSGTVVRWSSAIALTEIFKLSPKYKRTLLPVFEEILASEEKSSILKIYTETLKKFRS